MGISNSRLYNVQMTRRLSFIFSLLLFLSVNAHSVDIDSLFTQSVGGRKAYERLKKLKSFKLTGKMVWNGLEGMYTSYYLAPDKYKVSAQFEQFTFVNAYDGSIVWEMDLNGSINKLEGVEKQNFLAGAYMDNFKFIFEKQPVRPCQYIGIEKDDSLEFHEIICFPTEGDTLTMFLMAENSLITSWSSLAGHVPTTNYLACYTEVENVQFPLKTFIYDLEDSVPISISIDRVQFDIEIDPSIFTKPDNSYQDFYFPQDSTSITIPLIYSQGHLLARIQVNGKKKGWFILDSGSSATFYHDKFIKSLEIEEFANLNALGVGGVVNTQLIKIDSLAIGSIILFDQNAGVLDLADFVNKIPKKLTLGGILGQDFFLRFPVLLDFKREKMTVFNPDSFKPKRLQNGIPFILSMKTPTIKASLNGVIGDFIIDMGNAMGLLITESFGEKLLEVDKLLVDSSSSTYLKGVGQGINSMPFEVTSFKLNNLTIPIERGLMLENGGGLAGSRYISGNIGTMILENYQILFDYANSRLFLFEPGSSPFKPN